MPFLAALPAIAGAIGSIFGGASKGSSDSRNQQNQLQAMRDRTEVDKFGIAQNAQMQQGNLDLQRQQFGEQARGGRAKQALLGDLLANLKDVSVNVPGIQNATITGGLRPSAMGEGGRAAMQLLNQQALQKMLAGDTFQGGQILNAPRATPLQQPGLLEKILGTAGLVGSAVGGIGSTMQAQPKQQAPFNPELVNYDPSIYKTVNF